MRQAVDPAARQGGSLDLGAGRRPARHHGLERRDPPPRPHDARRPAPGSSPVRPGLTAGTTQAALKGFCWTSGNARLCADGQWVKNGPWNASGNLAAVPFSLLKPFLPPDLQITGAVGGTFTGTGIAARRGHRQRGAPPRPGRHPLPGKGGQHRRQVHFDQGTVRLVAGADGLTGHADLTFVNTGVPARRPAAAAVQQDRRFPSRARPSAGHIVANFTNLGLVEAFVPDLEQHPRHAQRRPHPRRHGRQARRQRRGRAPAGAGGRAGLQPPGAADRAHRQERRAAGRSRSRAPPAPAPAALTVAGGVRARRLAGPGHDRRQELPGLQHPGDQGARLAQPGGRPQRHADGRHRRHHHPRADGRPGEDGKKGAVQVSKDVIIVPAVRGGGHARRQAGAPALRPRPRRSSATRSRSRPRASAAASPAACW